MTNFPLDYTLFCMGETRDEPRKQYLTEPATQEDTKIHACIHARIHGHACTRTHTHIRTHTSPIY